MSEKNYRRTLSACWAEVGIGLCWLCSVAFREQGFSLQTRTSSGVLQTKSSIPKVSVLWLHRDVGWGASFLWLLFIFLDPVYEHSVKWLKAKCLSGIYSFLPVITAVIMCSVSRNYLASESHPDSFLSSYTLCIKRLCSSAFSSSQ